MPKNIIIIGGGISGLSLLHYLKIKYYFRKDVDVVLLEKEDRLGGTIQTLSKNGCLFESGPNGFLDSKPRTFEFLKDLQLENNLLRADEKAKIRYVSVRDTLYRLPEGLKSFFKFKLFSPLEKLRVLCEIFIPSLSDPSESVYDFGKRRLGEKFSKVFLDSMVSGIFAGDARRINLKAAFPKMYDLENKHGSLMKAVLSLQKQKKSNKSNRGGSPGMPSGTLTSFKKGMSEMIQTLASKYKESIQLNENIQAISVLDDQFLVCSESTQYRADELFVCVPSYCAALMLKGLSPQLAEELKKIDYAPVAVVGFIFHRSDLGNMPSGFGYLIPSSEQKEVLGVLFESNIFPGRCSDGQILLRVMIGGVHRGEVFERTQQQLFQIALEELQLTLGIKSDPRDFFIIFWPQAIPQYDSNYVQAIQNIEQQLKERQNLHLVANYIGGISMNDCIENAYQAAMKLQI